ncbi:hypothetical protein TWF506_004902 [Arthrobotrys conoides]|uniref:Uncharacterized protein n=1 Tax=Arthrobotrys conoides TaxID=74498 RepID=A0AAN8RVN1_9PEZI
MQEAGFKETLDNLTALNRCSEETGNLDEDSEGNFDEDSDEALGHDDFSGMELELPGIRSELQSALKSLQPSSAGITENLHGLAI